MKFDRKQLIAESLEMTMQYLDPTGSDRDGYLQAYIEAHIGPQPKNIYCGWSGKLRDAQARLRNYLFRLNDEALMDLIIDDQATLTSIAQEFFEIDESECEIQVVDLLAHELQIAAVRGYSLPEACCEPERLQNR